MQADPFMPRVADPFAMPYGENLASSQVQADAIVAAVLPDVADAPADIFELPYGVSPPRWVDKTDTMGERQFEGVAFNVLHMHEQLVRACCATRAEDTVLTPLLHERCSVHVREGNYVSSARELDAATDRAGAVALLRNLALAPALRMEPAEMLPGGDTRVHWCDSSGARYGQSATWSADGLALELVVVVEPPPTHREFVQALQQRSPYCAALLAPGVVLHDAAATHQSGSEVSGSANVLPRLLRWASDATNGQGGAELRVSRVSHLAPSKGVEQPGGRRTRLHAAGQWATRLADGEATACLLEETLEWLYTPPPPAALNAGRRNRAAGARRGMGGHYSFDGEPGGWQIWRIWRRTLALTEPSPEGAPPLPMNVYEAAALAGSAAVLCGPDDDDDLEESRMRSQSMIARRRPGREDASSDSEDDAEEANLMREIERIKREPLASRNRQEAAAPLSHEDANLHHLLMPPALPGMSAFAMPLKREVAAARRSRPPPAEQAAAAARAVAAVREMATNVPAGTSRQAQKLELERRVKAEVRRAMIAQRWELLSLRVRVRGKAALARLTKLKDIASDDEDGLSGGSDIEATEEEDEETRAAAMAYAGMRELSNGEILDVFEMAVTLLQLQIVADQPSVTRLGALLADGVKFTHKSGHHSSIPSAPPAPRGLAHTHDGKAAVIDHLKSGGQLKRVKNNVKSQQPAALMLDGRTRLNFAIGIDGGADIERLQDVIEWDDEGKIASWVRVYEPRRSQRDWLQLVSANRSGSFDELIATNAAFASFDGPEPRVHVGAPSVLEALKTMSTRLGGHISHIGRTRELSEWAWPKELRSGGAPAKKKGVPAPVVVQAIFIGSWRPLGAKWYGEREQAMRETAEWTGRQMTKLMWEPLPLDHPQARTVHERLRDKRRRAARAKRGYALKAVISEDRMNGNRPAWSNAQPFIPTVSKKGLKTAADKEMAPRPAPPPTLPPPPGKKK